MAADSSQQKLSPELPSAEGSHLTHGYAPSQGAACLQVHLGRTSLFLTGWYEGINVGPLCPKWDKNKGLSQFHNFPWDLLRPLLQLPHTSPFPAPASFPRSRVLLLRALPNKCHASKSQRLRICLPGNLTYSSIFWPCSEVPVYSSFPHSPYPNISKVIKTIAQVSSSLIASMATTLV